MMTYIMVSCFSNPPPLTPKRWSQEFAIAPNLVYLVCVPARCVVVLWPYSMWKCAPVWNCGGGVGLDGGLSCPYKATAGVGHMCGCLFYMQFATLCTESISQIKFVFPMSRKVFLTSHKIFSISHKVFPMSQYSISYVTPILGNYKCRSYVAGPVKHGNLQHCTCTQSISHLWCVKHSCYTLALYDSYRLSNTRPWRKHIALQNLHSW